MFKSAKYRIYRTDWKKLPYRLEYRRGWLSSYWTTISYHETPEEAEEYAKDLIERKERVGVVKYVY
jgi:hypothetical protein